MFKLPDLPYEYSALEPFIDEQTMHLHHDKHHAGYVEKLNAALDGHEDLASLSIEELLSNVEKVPSEIRQSVVNNGGGHANHSFFWEIMSPEKSEPKGKLLDAINSTFTSVEKFKEEFANKAMGVFGSGWAFLILTSDKKLQLKRHSFQNSPLMQGSVPILGIDVWEHAYYLKYQNKRAEYVNAWWNVVNWRKAEEIFNVSSS